MKELLENLDQLPTRVKLLILTGCLTLVAAGFFFFILSPVTEEVSALNQSLNGATGLRTQIGQLRTMARNLERYRARVALLDGELTKALEELPDDRDIEVLLASLSDKASDAGLEVRLVKPGAEQKRDFYAEVPVEIHVLGKYHEIAVFFDEIGHMRRIVNLDSIEMRNPYSLLSSGRGSGGNEPGKRNEIELDAKVVGTAFRFLSEDERPSVETEKDTKRRGRRTNKS